MKNRLITSDAAWQAKFVREWQGAETLAILVEKMALSGSAEASQLGSYLRANGVRLKRMPRPPRSARVDFKSLAKMAAAKSRRRRASAAG